MSRAALLLVLAFLVSSASAFAPTMSLRSSPAARSSRAAMHCSMKPLNNVAASAAVAAVLLSSSPMFAPEAMAAVAPNPYAKEQPAEAPKPANRNSEGGVPAAVYVGVPLIASVVLGVPFYKRNLERLAEKAAGKRTPPPQK